MQPKFTLKKGRIVSALLSFVFLFASMFTFQTHAQTALSTNYTAGGLTYLTGDAVVTFAIANANAVPVTLTKLDVYASATSSPGSTTGTLWYSATSLSGAPTVATPTWTVVAAGSPVAISADGFYTFLSGLSFTIPANTTYRFAFQSSNGVIYGNSTTAPNSFTADGLTLLAGNSQISAANIGYTGAFPTGTITPRYFYGTAYVNVPVCSGTPAPGNTVSSAPLGACPGVNFTLSLQNTTSGTGVTYQWQSASAAAGPWTNITGATASTYTTSQTVATYYRCNVTCSGNTGTSTALLAPMAPTSACYCLPPSTSCTASDVITNVTLGTLSNTSTCGTNGYTFYNSVTVPTVYAGAANPIAVSVDNGGTENVGVWIDYDQNGTFDASEFTAVGSGTGGVTFRNNINAPASALLGQTRMRVRVRWLTALGGTDACIGYTYGETEDYLVNIAPCVPVTITAAPANKSIACGSNTTFTVTTAGTLPVYAWEYKTPTGVWQNLANGGIYSGATTATLTLTNVSAAYNGYQYRALVSGGCSGVDFSTPAATLTVTPIVANTNPTSASICNGSIQAISLTNASSPATVTFSNTTALGIPDGTPNGVWSGINVTGIPAGAIISDISVKLNITHTWVGDLEINLLAPNGQNMNLIGELNNGTGSNSTANFTNTVISSTGTTALSGFAAPRTGTFKADMLTGYGPSAGPGGTGTGYQTGAITWAALQSVMNGNWQLGLSDWYSGDAGTLVNWSISITYGAPATGVWTASPATPNTMFTNAAATTAYVAGSQATTIYVNPTVTTTYSVVYATATPCTSNPTPVTVTVVNPVSAVVSPANKTVCVGSSATFTASATGGPLTYQWQQSADGGVTWTNRSGATSSTLTLTDCQLTWNGLRFRCGISAPPCSGTTYTNAAVLSVYTPSVVLSAPVVALVPGRTTSITGTSSPAATAWSWTLNGAALAGTTATQNVNIDGVGTYQATVTDVNGCVTKSNQLVIGSEASNQLWIYPNPTTGAFQVRYYFDQQSNEKRTISIYNPLGQLVAQKSFNLTYTTVPYLRMDVDLSGMARGTYVVKVANEYSGKIVSGLVLVQ